MKNKKARLTALILFAILFSGTVYADYSKDYLLWDGTEPLYSIGLDTTHHWWAKTQPFKERYRLIVDGHETDVYNNITDPVFSPDGNRWACFAYDNVQWYIITNDTVFSLPGRQTGEIKFSGNSQHLVYSYKNYDEEVIAAGDREIKTFRKSGTIFVNNNAARIAFMGKRGSGYVLNINGNETNVYEEIKPIGFWRDGKMLYAARNGYQWQIYKNEEEITDYYDNISEVKINLKGTAAAFLGSRENVGTVGVLISDEYYEPYVTRYYDKAKGLALHPHAPLMAFTAYKQGMYITVYNGTEYQGGETVGTPKFTHDGKQLYFIGCYLDCYAIIDGKKYPNITGVTPNQTIAMKPNSATIAYTTTSSLVMRFLNRDELVAGMMVDYTIAPRYNWRDKRYETLGVINNRLYLMTINY